MISQQLVNYLLMAGGVAMIYSVFYTINHLRPVKLVELLRPRDMRGTILKVKQETDLGLVCKPKDGVIHRFIKAGPGWTYSDKGRVVTKFFGIEGTAYTAITQSETQEASISDYVRHVWGDDFYEKLPSERKREIESGREGVTVDMSKINEKEHNLIPLSADDINDEDDSRMMKKFADSTKDKDRKKDLMNNVMYLAIGALLMYFLITRGYL